MGGYPARLAVSVVLLGLLSPATPAAAQVQELASGKLPVTTESKEARQLFLQGRELAEKIRATDARTFYEQAVAKDPNFAFAHLALANTAPTAKEFFASLQRAVTLADQASEGERLLILATDAGVKGDVDAQRGYLTKLVESHPTDERAHNALGNYYFGRQEWNKAIEEFQRATEINPAFSPAYNSLGYAYRSVGNYAKAETAFKRYIELIPDEPNPYDSYAELLMKTGRFEESISNYEKALSKNPNFVASYVGIGNNQIFLGRPDQARETFRKLRETIARNDGERRTALLWTAASYVHEGKTEAALNQIDQMYRIAEANGDKAAMAGDLTLTGNVLLHAGETTKALEKYRAAVQTMQTADVPDRVKANARRNLLYYEARVAIAEDDLEQASKKATAYGEQVSEQKIPFEVRRHHELLGRIALHQEDPGTAVSELTKANQQDPTILYLLAKAHHSAEDHAKAKTMAERAANFNGLSFNYAFVRAKAKKVLEQHG